MNLKLLAATWIAASGLAFADGDVVLDLRGNTEDTSSSLAAGPGGRLYATTVSAESAVGPESQSHVLAFDADGRLIPTFGTAGVVNDIGGPIALRPDGSVIVGGNPVRILDPNGVSQSFYIACGVFYPCDALTRRLYWRTFLPLADGRAYLGGGHRFRIFESDRWTFARLLADGAPDIAFAGNPDGWIQPDGGATSEIVKLARLSGTQFVALGWSNVSGALVLSRFNLDGSTDFTFGTNGLLGVGTSAVFAAPVSSFDLVRMPMVVDQSSRILLPGNANIVARRSANGALDNTYVGVATDAQTHYLTYVIDSQDRIVVFGERNGAIYVARLLPNGGLDPAFGTGGETVIAPPAAGTSNPIVSDGVVDSSDRPVALFTVVGATGRRDIGLVRLTSGGTLDTTFGAGVDDSDVLADPVAFASNSAPFGTANVVSSIATVTGINAPTSVVLVGPLSQGSSWSAGCTATFTQAAGIVAPGQSLCLRHHAPTTPGAAATTTIAIGGTISTYTTTSTAQAPDITPDPFALTDQAGVALNTEIVSAPITVTGITGFAPVAVNFGQYSVGCGPGDYRSSAGTVTNGQTICVRVRASTQFSTATTATLAINGITDTFTVTTLAADTTPGAFTFPAAVNVAQGASVMSVAITVTDINTDAPVSVTGGRYSVNCNAASLTSTAGTVGAGQFLCVEHTAASAPGTSVTTTVTVGSYSTTFTSTTAAAAGGGGGGGGGGGALTVRDLLALGVALVLFRVLPLLAHRRCRADWRNSGQGR